MLQNVKFVLALIVLAWIVSIIGVTLFGGSNHYYTDFILTLIAVCLVTSKLKISD